jgi:hypothetical protein
MDTYTFSDPSVNYPLTEELPGDRLFGACGMVLDCFDDLMHDRGVSGLELFFTGTSGVCLATAIAAVNRARPAPMNLAFVQVSKTDDSDGHHRYPVECTHLPDEKDGYPTIFIDDFVASGETFHRTRDRVRRESAKNQNRLRSFKNFNGMMVVQKSIPHSIEQQLQFLIHPKE